MVLNRTRVCMNEAQEKIVERLRPARPMPEEGYDWADPVLLTKEELGELETENIPRGVSIEVGYEHPKGYTVLTSPVRLVCDLKGQFYAEVRDSLYRKYFSAPIGLTEYAQLIRAAVEYREQAAGDVRLVELDDSEEAWIHLTIAIDVEDQLALSAWEHAQEVWLELTKPAEVACRRVDKVLTEVAATIPRVLQSVPLEELVKRVEEERDANEKGRLLEELMLRLFQQVHGWGCRSRRITATEEIDIVVMNESEDSLWEKEGLVILVECKNWSAKCGKDDFVVFERKMRNRFGRCRLGFFISWNGFTDKFTNEELRSCHEPFLVVPITGQEIKHSIASGEFPEMLKHLWEDATMR